MFRYGKLWSLREGIVSNAWRGKYRDLPIDLWPVHLTSSDRGRQVGVAYAVGVAGVT